MKRSILLRAASSAVASLAAAQVTVGPPLRVDVGNPYNANETTAIASEAAPLTVVAGWNDLGANDFNYRVGIGLSTDGGESWTRTYADTPGGVDPMTAACPRTGTLWLGGLYESAFGRGLFVQRKDPTDTAFGAAVLIQPGNNTDKPWMAAGPHPVLPDQTQLYIAFSRGLIRSSDMGATWTQPNSLGNGIGYLPRVAPDGTLYVSYWNRHARHRLWRSFDGGVTLEGPFDIATRMDPFDASGGHLRAPGFLDPIPTPSFAIDPTSGDLYAVYVDTTSVQGNEYNLDLYFTRSSDEGLTWSVPTVLNGDTDPPGDQLLSWMEVDARGRIHAFYFDTRHVPQNDDDPTAMIDVTYAFSEDQGASWTEERVTQGSFSSDHVANNGLFFGHYQGMSTAGGRTLPVYLDTLANSASNLFTNVITHGPTNYCMGILCACGNDDPDAGCGNLGFDAAPATGSLLSTSGSTSVSADDLVLRADGIRAGASGVLFVGDSFASSAFGDGRRCVGGAIYRYPVRRADAAGVVSYGPGELVQLSASFPPAGRVQVGSSWNYQLWYRDPNSPCANGFNTSNAVGVEWR